MSDSSVLQQAPVSKPEGRTTCTVIPGDGVGPELLYSVQEVFKVQIISSEINNSYLEVFKNSNKPYNYFF